MIAKALISPAKNITSMKTKMSMAITAFGTSAERRDADAMRSLPAPRMATDKGSSA
jgi:hypothetical protein